MIFAQALRSITRSTLGRSSLTSLSPSLLYSCLRPALNSPHTQANMLSILACLPPNSLLLSAALKAIPCSPCAGLSVLLSHPPPLLPGAAQSVCDAVRACVHTRELKGVLLRLPDLIRSNKSALLSAGCAQAIIHGCRTCGDAVAVRSGAGLLLRLGASSAETNRFSASTLVRLAGAGQRSKRGVVSDQVTHPASVQLWVDGAGAVRGLCGMCKSGEEGMRSVFEEGGVGVILDMLGTSDEALTDELCDAVRRISQQGDADTLQWDSVSERGDAVCWMTQPSDVDVFLSDSGLVKGGVDGSDPVLQYAGNGHGDAKEQGHGVDREEQVESERMGKFGRVHRETSEPKKVGGRGGAGEKLILPHERVVCAANGVARLRAWSEEIIDAKRSPQERISSAHRALQIPPSAWKEAQDTCEALVRTACTEMWSLLKSNSRTGVREREDLTSAILDVAVCAWVHGLCGGVRDSGAAVAGRLAASARGTLLREKAILYLGAVGGSSGSGLQSALACGAHKLLIGLAGEHGAGVGVVRACVISLAKICFLEKGRNLLASCGGCRILVRMCRDGEVGVVKTAVRSRSCDFCCIY